MFDLLLVALFTAFFLALLDNAIELIAIFIGALATNTIVSLSLSTLGHYLIGTEFDKKAIVTIISTAFLGRVLLKTTERLISYKPVIIKSTGQ